MSMELQGSGWHVKLYSWIYRIRNINGCTPVCTFFQQYASCAKKRYHMHQKAPHNHFYTYGSTICKPTVIHMWYSLKAR